MTPDISLAGFSRSGSISSWKPASFNRYRRRPSIAGCCCHVASIRNHGCVSVSASTPSPDRYAGRRLDVRLGAERVEVFDGAKVVAPHPRASGKGTETLVLDHYLGILTRKPGALPNATALARAKAAGDFTSAHQQFWDLARKRLGDRQGTLVLINVLLLHRQLTGRAVVAGINAALKIDSLDPAVIAVEARRSIDPAKTAVVPIGEHLARFDRPTPVLNHYDNLLEAQ